MVSDLTSLSLDEKDALVEIQIHELRINSWKGSANKFAVVEESCGALSKMGYQLNASTQMKLNHNLVKKQRQSRSTSKTSRIRKTASSTIIPLSTDTTTSRAAENTVQTSNSLTSLTSMLNSINDQLFNVDVSV
ncbi:unnamed protein product [Adineta ricciae]|uniref:Uncharacterized protein n=1 Tax=Adineta ricciae TaxID=249248 RepID=A0A815MCT5_ADIRI|nr:unnamed protein product [Adineta ricciae]